MEKKKRASPEVGLNEENPTDKKERTARISDEDWRDIRRASKETGRSAGDYFVYLHRRKGPATRTSPSDTAMRSALEMLMTQLTRAIMHREALSDDIFESLLVTQNLMLRIIETK